MTTEIHELKEGIFNVIEKEYHASPGVSKSSLDHMDKSPLHYIHAKNNPTEQTPAMAFGSLVHCLLLEPERMDDEYATKPCVDGRTKEGKAINAEFLIESEGKTVVSSDDMNKAYAMISSIKKNTLANMIMTQEGVNEKAIYSVDEETQILKRGKIDRICESNKMIVDLKTTSDGSPKGFQSSIFKYNYHMQAAYYIDLCQEQGLDINRFVFVVVEKTAPYAVSVFELEQDYIDLGRAQYKKHLRTLSECLEADLWPSYSSTIINASLPNWAK